MIKSKWVPLIFFLAIAVLSTADSITQINVSQFNANRFVCCNSNSSITLERSLFLNFSNTDLATQVGSALKINSDGEVEEDDDDADDYLLYLPRTSSVVPSFSRLSFPTHRLGQAPSSHLLGVLLLRAPPAC
jgi:hypothetical protein